MTQPQQNEPSENQRLADKYRPLLVLYPEIEDGSQRNEHHHPDYGPGKPPLDQDYHPRDIRLVLDQAHLPGKKGYLSRDDVLDSMSENRVDHIDLIDRGGPKEVDKYWRVYAGITDKDSNPEYRRKAYARVIKGSGRFKDYISIQYWMAYFFDDWANVHEMDWEMVSVILKKTDTTEEPVACVFNAHRGAFRQPWKDVHKADDAGNMNPEGPHPVAYIANGSHASYFSDYPSYFSVAAPYLDPVIRRLVRIAKIGKPFTEYVPCFAEGAKHFPDIEVIPQPDESGRWAGDWRWLNFKGNWGSPLQLSLSEKIVSYIPVIGILARFFQRPMRIAGPPGPNTKGTCWEEPFDWANLECYEAPKTSNWIGKSSGADTNEL
jgi:hypothetical protein